MATPADQRLLELLAKWLGSLDLHLKYSSLDADSYWKIQSWQPHERPSRWIIELAKQKTLALKAQVEERVAMGDARFSDALELMAFLANLVGSEHIERFIPIAEQGGEKQLPKPPDASDLATTVQRTRVQAAPADTGTREMPPFRAVKPRAPPPVGTAHVARTERKQPPVPTKARAKAHAKAAPAARAAPAQATPSPPVTAPPQVTDAVVEQVIADAARLMQWGRKWYELPELIARMADRPALPEVRRILKDSKPQLDKKSGPR